MTCPACGGVIFIGSVSEYEQTPALFCDCGLRVGICLIVTQESDI